MYKHHQIKGIKKNLQNDPKLLCSSSLAIIMRPLYWRKSTRNNSHEKSIEKQKQKKKKCS